MSFKGLYEYVDYLSSLYKEGLGTEYLVLDLLVNYYATALSSNRLRDQRDYCKTVIYKLNPDYAKGYFERKQGKISNKCENAKILQIRCEKPPK
jgi:hypothetical protein